jgi:hypothetical protein
VPDNAEPRRHTQDSKQRQAMAAGMARRLIDVAARAVAKDLDCDRDQARRLLILAVEILQRER